MTRETIRRRRGRSSAGSASRSTTEEQPSTTTVAASPSSVSELPTPQQPKTVEELIEEEDKSFSQFLSLCGIVTLVFLYMIRTTELPPSRRVYAVMMDAGSTGTRAQVFQFVHDQDTKRLELVDTKIHNISKSIAALGTGHGGTGPQFFKPLLENSKKSVPGMRRRRRTPIILLATAGLRLLGNDAAEHALNQARLALNASEFRFREDYVSILNPRDEAMYGWITVNYLLGKFGESKSKRTPVATLELGGASVQVTHAVDDDSSGRLQKVHMFGKIYKLRATSHLGFGLFGFTSKLYRTFELEDVLEEGNPCFRKGKVFTEKSLRLGVTGSEESRIVTIVGDGDFHRCVASAEIVIASFTTEGEESFPKLPRNSIAYAFAYFYDRTVGLGLSSEPTKEELWNKGKELCESDPSEIVKGDFDEACAEFAYIYSIIKMVTDDFSKDRGVRVRFEQFVNGHMLGWALGATLDIVQPVMGEQISLDNEPLTIS